MAFLSKGLLRILLFFLILGHHTAESSAQITYTVANGTSTTFHKFFVYYETTGGSPASYVITGIPPGQTTATLPSNCDHITGVRIYCYNWSQLCYVGIGSTYCSAWDPYEEPCYTGRFTEAYRCPSEGGFSSTTSCATGNYCIIYQHCNDDNWDNGTGTGHCMNNGALRITDPGPNYCGGGGSPRCEFP